ncbi:MAG: tetratricopeptide repeat protein [Limisphaerales bacterium]
MSSEVTESSGFYEFLAWLEINKKRLIVAAIVLAVAGLGIATYRWQASQREEAAYAALFRLGAPMAPVDNAAAPSASAYLKVANEYVHTRAGEQALLLAAGDLFKSGDYAEARVQFEKFLNQYHDSTFAPAAVFGVASALDALNRTDEAQKAYQDLTLRHSTSPIAPQAKLALAGLFESKKQPEQALKLYDELVQSTPPTAWASEARARREELLRQHPNLIKVEAGTASTPSSIRPQMLLAPGTMPVQRGSTSGAVAKPAGPALSRPSAPKSPTNGPAAKTTKP